MLNNNRCVLAYGFNEEEIRKLKIYVTGIRIVTAGMSEMKIRDITDGIKIETYSNEEIEEKVIIFNSYPESEIKTSIKKLRQTFPGVILAVVTPVSIEWSFRELLAHLLEEKAFEKKERK